MIYNMAIIYSSSLLYSVYWMNIQFMYPSSVNGRGFHFAIKNNAMNILIPVS